MCGTSADLGHNLLSERVTRCRRRRRRVANGTEAEARTAAISGILHALHAVLGTFSREATITPN